MRHSTFKDRQITNLAIPKVSNKKAVNEQKLIATVGNSVRKLLKLLSLENKYYKIGNIIVMKSLLILYVIV